MTAYRHRFGLWGLEKVVDCWERNGPLEGPFTQGATWVETVTWLGAVIAPPVPFNSLQETVMIDAIDRNGRIMNPPLQANSPNADVHFLLKPVVDNKSGAKFGQFTIVCRNDTAFSPWYRFGCVE